MESAIFIFLLNVIAIYFMFVFFKAKLCEYNGVYIIMFEDYIAPSARTMWQYPFSIDDTICRFTNWFLYACI